MLGLGEEAGVGVSHVSSGADLWVDPCGDGRGAAAEHLGEVLSGHPVQPQRGEQVPGVQVHLLTGAAPSPPP